MSQTLAKFKESLEQWRVVEQKRDEFVFLEKFDKVETHAISLDFVQQNALDTCFLPLLALQLLVVNLPSTISVAQICHLLMQKKDVWCLGDFSAK